MAETLTGHQIQVTYLDVLGSDAHPHRVLSHFVGRVRCAVGAVAVVHHRRLRLAEGVEQRAR